MNGPMHFLFTHLIHHYDGNINYSQFEKPFGWPFTASVPKRPFPILPCRFYCRASTVHKDKLCKSLHSIVNIQISTQAPAPWHFSICEWKTSLLCELIQASWVKTWPFLQAWLFRWYPLSVICPLLSSFIKSLCTGTLCTCYFLPRVQFDPASTDPKNKTPKVLEIWRPRCYDRAFVEWVSLGLKLIK